MVREGGWGFGGGEKILEKLSDSFQDREVYMKFDIYL